MAHALIEAGGEEADAAVGRALEWLKPLQILDLKGDWAVPRPATPPGGWAFQYVNEYYPDLDDTAVVVMAMDRAGKTLQSVGPDEYTRAIADARRWVEGMQSHNGGFGAFDADNDHTYLNYIPFADHGALLDPPTADVTARCVSMFAQLGETPQNNLQVASAVDYLLREQEKDGSWYGRWGINYIYGTWSVLCALNAAGLDQKCEAFQRAVTWLKAIQNEDGGWGERGDSYAFDYAGYKEAPSTASQTAWALLALMAAGEVNDSAVARGIRYLLNSRGETGSWHEGILPGPDFLGCSTCDITVIRSSSRFGRWRASGIAAAPIIRAFMSACKDRHDSRRDRPNRRGPRRRGAEYRRRRQRRRSREPGSQVGKSTVRECFRYCQLRNCRRLWRRD